MHDLDPFVLMLAFNEFTGGVEYFVVVKGVVYLGKVQRRGMVAVFQDILQVIASLSNGLHLQRNLQREGIVVK